MLICPLDKYIIKTNILTKIKNLPLGEYELELKLPARPLDDIDSELQDTFTLSPASHYVRETLKDKIAKRPDLAKMEDTVLDRILQHDDVQERDRQEIPLNDIEKKHFKTTLDRVIGGCCSPNSHLPAIKEAEEFVTAIYKKEECKQLRLGTIISFLQNYCLGLLNFARFSHNTLRKIMKSVSPLTASKRGRGNPNELHLLKSLVWEMYSIAV